MRDTVLEILEDMRPDIDFENETALVSGGLLASFDVVSLVTMLTDEFDITIRPKELVPANFDSLDAICEMVERLQED